MLDEDALKRFEHVEAVLAIQKLKHTYWHYNDTGLRGDKVAQLFTEDGVWSNAELGHYEGREAIRTFFNGASELIPFCAHVGMNEIIDIDGEMALPLNLHFGGRRQGGEPRDPARLSRRFHPHRRPLVDQKAGYHVQLQCRLCQRLGRRGEGA